MTYSAYFIHTRNYLTVKTARAGCEIKNLHTPRIVNPNIAYGSTDDVMCHSFWSVNGTGLQHIRL